MKNGIFILADNIKIDETKVLSYTQQQMLDLVRSHKTAESSNYSFIRHTENNIRVEINYNTALNSNYIAFQNPNYSYKWFFAFVEEVTYVSDLTCDITFRVDYWSTWFDNWSPRACYIIREHVNNDDIGQHTLIEDIETGDYISTNLQPIFGNKLETCFVLSVTELLVTGYTYFNQSLPMGLYYIGLDDLQGITDYVKKYSDSGKADAVVSVFVIPKKFFNSWGTTPGITGNTSYSIRFDYFESVEIQKPSYLGDNYIPKNNKLFCYPYSYLMISNQSGSSIILQWELFNLLKVASEDKYEFNLIGTITPGGSFKLYPINYQNMLDNYNEGITLGKFPIGSFNTDVYTNWITQNGVNVAIDFTKNMLGFTKSIISKDVNNVANSSLDIASSVASIYQHKMIPNQVGGDINSGDVNFVYGLNNILFSRMSIKNEFARKIDDYFTRFGYKLNIVDVPHITGRKNWNYIQIGDGENIGYGSVPAKHMNEINKICRRGITIWHNHENMGDYSLSNEII